MKITFIKIIAAVVLAGMMHVTVIEPAICSMHEEAASHQEEKGQCCVACHPAHHQAIIASDIAPDFTETHFSAFVKLPRFTLADSPARSIFHPPHAL